MKAMVLHAIGRPLVLEDVAEPVVGPNDIKIRVKAIGVGLTVVHMIANPGQVTAYPRIPGHAVAGEIVALGSEVSGFAIGQRVTNHFYLTCGQCRYCRAGRETLCIAFKGYVGMACDGDAGVGIAGEPLRLTLQRCLIFGIHIETIGFKQNAVAKLANLLEEIFLAARNDRVRFDNRRRWGRAIIGAFGRRWQFLDLFLAAACNECGRCQQYGGDLDSVRLHGLLLRLTRICIAESLSEICCKRTHGNTGPHAGSDPSTGVGNLRSFDPVRSTCQILVLPLPLAVRKNWMTRPFGAHVGASSCQLSVNSRSPEPSGRIVPTRKSPAMRV
jgi:hypothetical protein